MSEIAIIRNLVPASAASENLDSRSKAAGWSPGV